MVPQVCTARRFAVKDMESPGKIRNLTLLIQNATVLRNRVNQASRRSGRDSLAAGQRSDSGACIILPRLTLIITVGIPQVVVRDNIWSLSPCPRSLDTAIQVVETVDVGVVIAALEVLSNL